MILSRRLFHGGLAAGAALAVGLPRLARAQSWDANISDFDKVLGQPDAPVTMIEYASFTCGHCATFHLETLPEIKTRYIDSGTLQFVFRDFPLDGLALRAGMLARCVDENRFFTVVDVLFERQRQWAGSGDPLEALRRIGQLAGLSDDAFNACMEDEALANQIIELRLDAEQRYDVSSTPTFVINGDVVSGAWPIDRFAELIEGAV